MQPYLNIFTVVHFLAFFGGLDRPGGRNTKTSSQVTTPGFPRGTWHSGQGFLEELGTLGYVAMPGELVQRVIEACVTLPGGRTGELDRLVRMLGAGM